MSDSVHPAGFDAGYAAEQLRRSRHTLRCFVKGLYLRNLVVDVCGLTVDLSCGAGQLLRRLPVAPTGLEVNPNLVEALCREGLDVRLNAGDAADFDLVGPEPGWYRTLVIAHVLEHLPDPVAALRRLLVACRGLGIERVVAVVPGPKGYRSDAIHRTFIDRAYVENRVSSRLEGYRRGRTTWFPGPWAWIGRHFVFHEMNLVFHLDGRPDGR